MTPFKMSSQWRASAIRRKFALGLRYLLCALWLAGCEPSRDQDLGSRTVPITFPASLLENEAPLRYALVWTTASDASSYYKELVSVSDGAVNDATFSVTFSYPQNLDAELAPTELLYFTSPETLNVFRPRVVLYEDANGNASFDPKLTDAGPIDTIVALDANSGPAVTAIPKLRQQIAALPPEQVQEYYASTGNRLTPFILSDGSLGNRYLASSNPSELSLLPWNSTTGLEDLRCGRTASYGYFSAKRSVYLDENVSTPSLSFCAQANACQETDFEALPLDEDQLPIPPTEPEQGTAGQDGGTVPSDAGSISDAGGNDSGGLEQDESGLDAALGLVPRDPLAYATTLQLQCRQRAGVVALVLIDPQRVTCESCVCSSEQVSYIANPQALPAWWPCGGERPYCEGTNLITDFDAACSSYEATP